MKICIAADHGGIILKENLKDAFGEYDWLDLGTQGSDSVDYPDYAHKLADALKQGQADFGVLICGSGIGISIAANRHAHIRAALCTNEAMATLSRQHNDANVLVMGERIIGFETAKAIFKAFMAAQFEAGRHQNRVDKINT